MKSLLKTTTIILLPIFMIYLFVSASIDEMIQSITGGSNSNSSISYGATTVNEEVLKLKPKFEAAMKEIGMPAEYLNLLLAICQVESGGRSEDVMQCSESLNKPPNTLGKDESIKQGTKYLWSQIQSVGNDLCKKDEAYLKTAVQSYNYGGAFVGYANTNNGKKYTLELATAYAKERSGGKVLGDGRYAYGDQNYVSKVWSYMSSGQPGQIQGGGSALGNDQYKKLMEEALKYQGNAYVWGGSTPQTGFDCSGLTQWCYQKIGYQIGRDTVAQYANTVAVTTPKSGDLIFFRGTYGAPNFISHVGIYIDANTMYDSSDSGIGYHSWNNAYYKAHKPEIRRPIKR